MPRTSQAEISMRHFPDTSDVSIQIRSYQDEVLLTENRLGDLELDLDAFDDGDYGGIDNDPFTTPLPKFKKHTSLTLSELTPRTERERAGTAGQRDGPSSSKENKVIAERERGKESTVRPILPEKELVDDMFERRKRDNYQQMGIDLSSKSTARLRREKVQSVTLEATQNAPYLNVDPSVRVNMAGKFHEHPSGNLTNGMRKRKTKRPVLDKDAGVEKHKSRVASSIKQPKSILKQPKPSALPSSVFTRALSTASHTPKAERPKWEDVVAEVQKSQRRDSNGSGISAIGGGLIDVLVMYGEKLKGSLGFSSSAGKASTLEAPIMTSTSSRPTTDAPRSVHNVTETSGHPIQDTNSERPLTLSDLTPATSKRQHQTALTLSELSPIKQDHPKEENNSPGDQRQSDISPMRPSKKRPSAEPIPEIIRKDKPRRNMEMYSAPSSSSRDISEHTRTRTGVTDKGVSKPKPLGPSHIANNVMMRPTPPSRPASVTENSIARSHRPGAATYTRDLKGKSDKNLDAMTRNRHAEKGRHAPIDSMPSGAVTVSDIYQQRALEKTQKEREKHNENEKHKRSFKAGPHFSKPAPPARRTIRPTVPAAFKFHSDARATQRNAEFEEKRKTWESRATHHALPMPDFAAMHAAQAEAVCNRRVVPVLPTEAPVLTTIARAKEREKFEAERRERERALEQQREIREREKAEQEEREYREARKRTVPKAHEVPDWYRDLPRRKDVG